MQIPGMNQQRQMMLDAAEAKRAAAMRGMYTARDAVGGIVSNPYVTIPAGVGAAGLGAYAGYQAIQEPNPIDQRERALGLLDAHLSPYQQQQLSQFIDSKNEKAAYVTEEAAMKAQMLNEAAAYKEAILQDRAAKQLQSLDMMQI
ncbi:MAG: hypothetical protein WBF90_33675 [Rivularia sp. (in: cyanobacteria)]